MPDAQAAVGDAAAIAAVVQALSVWLAERDAAGERLPVAPAWRIEENRWSACRHGVEGELADLESGERRPTRERLSELLATLRPVAERLGAGQELRRASDLVALNGALLQRRAAQEGGARAVARWLADRFLEPLTG